MNKIYIDNSAISTLNLAFNADIQTAVDGFVSLGFDIIKITDYDVDINKHIPIIASIDKTKKFIVENNKNFDWIENQLLFVLKNYAKRNIIEVELNEIRKKFISLSIEEMKKESKFIKPLETKLFDGIILNSLNDLNYINRQVENKNAICIISDVEKIISEFRCFIHYDKLIDCRNYKGKFDLIPDFDYINSIIKSIKQVPNKPVAYTIDVMITENLETKIIEINDFWCIGNYGLEPEKYAIMLKDRWYQIFS